MATFGRQKIADERFVERTGKSLREWIRLLDRWGAPEKGHTATARHLEKDLGLDGWWAQAVTIQGRDAFAKLSPSHKREYVQWINQAKRPETRTRRAAETVKKLTDS